MIQSHWESTFHFPPKVMSKCSYMVLGNLYWAYYNGSTSCAYSDEYDTRSLDQLCAKWAICYKPTKEIWYLSFIYSRWRVYISCIYNISCLEMPGPWVALQMKAALSIFAQYNESPGCHYLPNIQVFAFTSWQVVSVYNCVRFQRHGIPSKNRSLLLKMSMWSGDTHKSISTMYKM